MLANQLIISVVVFGTLLYLMSTKKDDIKKGRENFYFLQSLQQTHIVPSVPQNRALWYRPGYPYPQHPNIPPQPVINAGQFRSFNQIKNSDNEMKGFIREDTRDLYIDTNQENFSSETKYDSMMGPMGPMGPKVGKNDTKIVKITFGLMFAGLLYYIYDSRKNSE